MKAKKTPYEYNDVTNEMLQNSSLTQELSLATTFFAISVLELTMLSKIRQKCP